MSYYDSHNEFTSVDNKNNRGRHMGLSAFFGAIIGSLTVVIVFSTLAYVNVLPFNTIEVGSESVTLLEDTEEHKESVDLNMVNYSITSDVIDAVEHVSDAVVGVINMHESTSFFSPGGEGTGSGVIYKIEGDHAFVVTNYHVIEGANQIEVTLSSGKRIPAEIIGEDVLTDLALLKIASQEVSTVATFGNSELLKPGEPAIAIGNPLSFEGSVTLGIISAVERSIPIDLNGNGRTDWNAEVLQTDAAINPGNSGGALLNIHGEVIGINSMKIAQHAVEGIGFAIPSSIVVPIVDDLIEYGEVYRPKMGVSIRSLNEIPSFHWQTTIQLPEEISGGVYIEFVETESPAALAGIEVGDVIVELDGEEITDVHDLRTVLYTRKKIGDDVTVGFYRNGIKKEVILTLEQ